MTLQVVLTNYRLHTKRQVTFSSGLTHLAGDSGTGKSSIVHAIRWCLYGTPKDVYPRDKKRRVSVVLTYTTQDHVVEVSRSTDPITITFTRDGKRVVGEEAVAAIEEYFGPARVWYITGYLAQQSLHPFITDSSTDSTNAFLTLLDDQAQRDSLTKLNAQLYAETKTKEALSQYNVPPCDCPPTALTPTNTIIEQLTDTRQQLTQLEEQIASLRQQLKQCQLLTELAALGTPQPTPDLRKELVVARQAEATTARRLLLESQRNPVGLSFSVSETKALLNTVARRRVEEERCPCEYDKQKIEEKKKELKTLAETHTRRLRLEEELTHLPPLVEGVVEGLEEQVDSDARALSEVEGQLSCPVGAPCPSCGVLLSVTGGQFTLGALTHEQHEALRTRRSTLHTRLAQNRSKLHECNEAQRKRTMIEQELSTLPLVEESQLLHNVTMQSIVWYEPVQYTEDVLRTHLADTEREHELQQLPVAQRMPSEVEEELSRAEKRDHLVSLLTGGASPSSTVAIEASIAENERQVTEKKQIEEVLLQQLRDAERTNELYYAHSECATKRTHYARYKEAERACTVLTTAIGEHATSSEEVFASALSVINGHLVNYSKLLFDKDIVLRLTSARTKRGVIVECVAVCDTHESSVTSLSGGEKKRASIALLCALLLYRMPLFVVLDEPFGENQAVWEDAMLDVVRSVTTNTPCVIMNYGDMGSSVDHVVSL